MAAVRVSERNRAACGLTGLFAELLNAAVRGTPFGDHPERRISHRPA
ncbi:hypothetical protein [Dactylosporangium sp. NPDC051484]